MKFKIESNLNSFHCLFITISENLQQNKQLWRSKRKWFWICFYNLENKKRKQWWTYCSKNHKRVASTYKTGFGNRYVIKGQKSKRLSKQKLTCLNRHHYTLRSLYLMIFLHLLRLRLNTEWWLETVEIKKEMGTDKPDGTTISTKMDGSAKKSYGCKCCC